MALLAALLGHLLSLLSPLQHAAYKGATLVGIVVVVVAAISGYQEELRGKGGTRHGGSVIDRPKKVSHCSECLCSICGAFDGDDVYDRAATILLAINTIRGGAARIPLGTILVNQPAQDAPTTARVFLVVKVDQRPSLLVGAVWHPVELEQHAGFLVCLDHAMPLESAITVTSELIDSRGE